MIHLHVNNSKRVLLFRFFKIFYYNCISVFIAWNLIKLYMEHLFNVVNLCRRKLCHGNNMLVFIVLNHSETELLYFLA